MLPFLRAALRDWTRGWLLRPGAAEPGLGGWSRSRIGIFGALLVLTWGSAAPAAMLVAPSLAGAGHETQDALGLLLAVFSLALGALAATAAIAPVAESDPLLRGWPLSPAAVFVPDLLIALVQGLAVGVFSTAPMAFTLALASGGGTAAAVLAALATLAAYLVAASLLTLAGAAVLRYRLARNVDGVLTALALGGLGLIVGGGLMISRALAPAGLAGLARLAAAADAAVGVPLLAGLLGGNRTDAILVLASMPIAVLALTASSALLEANRLRLANVCDDATVRGARRAAPSGLGGPLGPFVRKDLLIARREPFILLRQLLTVAAFVALLLFASPGRRPELLVFAVLVLPATLCGVTLLHAIGQEGSLLQTIRAAGATRRMLASKLAVGLATMPLLSACLGAGILAVGTGVPPRSTVAATGLLVALVAAVDVVLALGLGGLFVDLAVKRIGKDRGVGVGGELLYWLVSGVIALGFYLVAADPLTARATGTAGVLIALAGALAVLVLYLAGHARLEASDAVLESGGADESPSPSANH